MERATCVFRSSVEIKKLNTYQLRVCVSHSITLYTKYIRQELYFTCVREVQLCIYCLEIFQPTKQKHQ